MRTWKTRQDLTSIPIEYLGQETSVGSEPKARTNSLFGIIIFSTLNFV